MAYREVTMVEIKEVLRLWRAGAKKKRIAAQLTLDVKTVRRYVAAAEGCGLAPGPEPLSDEQVAAVVVPRGTPKTGQSGTPENRPVVEQLQDVDGRVGTVVPRRGECLERRQVPAGDRTGPARLEPAPDRGCDASPSRNGERLPQSGRDRGAGAARSARAGVKTGQSRGGVHRVPDPSRRQNRPVARGCTRPSLTRSRWMPPSAAS